MRLLPLTTLALALSALSADAQTINRIVKEGDPVPGVGDVSRIDNLAVNIFGTWRVEVDTNNTNVTEDSVLLKDGVLELQEGQVLAGSVLLDTFDAINVPIDETGGWNFFLDGTAGSSDDSGVYHGTDLLIQEGGATISPDFTPGSTYLGFLETKAIPGTILMMASLDDPAIIGSGSVDRVLVKAHHDGAGNLLVEEKVAAEGDVPPGQINQIIDIENGPHHFAMNALGQVMYTVDLDGNTNVDHAVYIDDTLIAQEGSPSGIDGRNWLNLSLAEVDINDQGDWVISGGLDGSSLDNLIIVKNGQKLVQEGDVLPDIAPFEITSFGSGPVCIADNGDVLWFGDWGDPDLTKDTGLFVNDKLIVQEGVSMAGGSLITLIRGVQDGYAFSDNAQHVIFEVLQGSDEAVCTIDRGGFLPFPSCAGNPAKLRNSMGVPAIGQTFSLDLDDALAPGSIPFLGTSFQPWPTFPPCGLTLPGGELMVDATPPNPILISVGPLWSPGNPSTITLVMPNDPGLVGREFWTQGLFYLQNAMPKLYLTNALKLEVGE